MAEQCRHCHRTVSGHLPLIGLCPECEKIEQEMVLRIYPNTRDPGTHGLLLRSPRVRALLYRWQVGDATVRFKKTIQDNLSLVQEYRRFWGLYDGPDFLEKEDIAGRSLQAINW
jgi:hypothetical protein